MFKALKKEMGIENTIPLVAKADASRPFSRLRNDKELASTLEKLGRLSDDSLQNDLLSLLEHKNENIRTLAIKNLGKIGALSLLPVFAKYARTDSSTSARREAVSAIGRLRNENAIPVLTKLLEDEDPKIVMQAIRGLLIFYDQKPVQEKLEKLKNHPNELIREMVHQANQKQSKTEKQITPHKTFPNFMKNKIVNGNVLDIMKNVPDESIHLTFTSPPYYNARDYSIYKSYQDYLSFLEKVFQELHRTTKEGRFFVLNTSPIIIPRISRAHSSKRYPIPFDIHPLLVKMGWEFIDDIVWIKPEASVKNRTAGFLQHRKPLAYKPNPVTEMLMVYRKKTSKLIDWNIKQYDYDTVKESKVMGDYDTKNVWYIEPCFDKIHSAVFPISLCERVIKYYSFVGDLVFDPFAGSGTLGRAAKSLNRHFFLTEKETKYIYRMKELLEKDELFESKSNRLEFLNHETFKKNARHEK